MPIFRSRTGCARIRPLIRALLALLAIVPLAACESLTGFLFFPRQEWVQTPDRLGLDWEQVELETGDGERLVSWWLPPVGHSRGSILFLHGNGENISTHLFSVSWLPEAGYGVFLLDYRGYGQSTGVPRLPQVFEDIRVSHAWLMREQSGPYYVLGQSLGGTLGLTYLANQGEKQRRFDRAVIEAAPASLPQVAREAMRSSWVTWILQLPVSLLPSEYDPVEQSPEHLPPVLLLHGGEDSIVAPHHAEQLLGWLGDRAELSTYPGGHIQAFRFEDQRQRVLRYLQSETAHVAERH